MWVYVFADDVYTWGNKKCSNIGKKTNNIGKITIFCRKNITNSLDKRGNIRGIP